MNPRTPALMALAWLGGCRLVHEAPVDIVDGMPADTSCGSECSTGGGDTVGEAFVATDTSGGTARSSTGSDTGARATGQVAPADTSLCLLSTDSGPCHTAIEHSAVEVEPDTAEDPGPSEIP